MLFRSGLGGGIKGVFNKDNLMLAGGVALAGVVSTKIVSSVGKAMPDTIGKLTSNPYAAVAVYAAPPVIAGYYLRRYNRSLGNGLIIGGVASALVGALKAASPSTAQTLGFSAYLGAPMLRRPLPATSPNPAMKAFGSALPRAGINPVLASTPAFANDAWTSN